MPFGAEYPYEDELRREKAEEEGNKIKINWPGKPITKPLTFIEKATLESKLKFGLKNAQERATEHEEVRAFSVVLTPREGIHLEKHLDNSSCKRIMENSDGEGNDWWIVGIDEDAVKREESLI